MQKLIKYIVLTLILIAIGTGSYIYLKNHSVSEEKITAASTNDSLSSQADWESGSLSSALDIITISGSMIIDTSETEINLTGKSVSADIYDGNSANVIDSDELTGWGFTETEGSGHWWKIDLGIIETSISKVGIYAAGDAAVEYQLQYSDDDISYTTWGNLTHGTLVWEDNNPISPTIDARYIKIVVNFSGMPGEVSGLNEIKLYQAALSATHTSASTQIDGQEGSADKTLIEWTSFTPTQTTPANTSISYEFRTSTNGTDWTSWSTPQTYSGSPLDLTTLTPNRYLQVRSTLTTSDALFTPQIDDYTINFHNNQKPNKPTAQTAIISD